MKNRLFCLLLALVLLLSGCACQHEWVDADCTSPQICTKCQETTGEALGHSWTEATCETPQTCSRCGQTEGAPLGHDWTAATCVAPVTCLRCGLTEGAPLGHSFGFWTASGADMTRSCLTCGEAETVPYDGLTYSRSNLVGFWDFFSINEVASSYYGPLFYLQFSQDGTFLGRMNKTMVEGKWYLEETPTDEGYGLSLEYDGETTLGIYSPEYNELLILDEYGYAIYFEKNQDAGPLLGVWSGEADGNAYSFALSYDRSFYATLDTTFHGTWSLLPESTMHSKTTGEVFSISILVLIPDESYGLKDSYVYISPSADGGYEEPSFVQWFPASGVTVEFSRSPDVVFEEDV